MTLSEYVITANKTSIPVSFDKWVNLKQYYMSMYRFYMLKLCDYGYITDPTVFNQVEIRTALNDYKISDFKDVCGNICLTSEFAYFALCRLKGRGGDEEDIQFLECLYNALKYREYYIELDKQYEIDNKKIKLRLGITTCTNVTSMTDVKLNRGVLKLLVDEDETLIEASFSEDMFNIGMRILGISKDQYCDGMFISGLSLQKEIQFARLILDGEVSLDGKYANILTSWLSEHKWSDGAYKNANSKGLYSYIHGTCDSEIFKLFDQYTEEYADSFVAALGDKIYLRKKISKYRLPISPFCVLTSQTLEDEVITDHQALFGYCGECYTYLYLQEEGYNFIGIPVKVNNKGIETEVYDVSQIIRPYNINTWFSLEGVDFTFEDNIENTISNPYIDGTLEHEMFEAYRYGMCGKVYGIECKEGFSAIKAKRKEVTKMIVNLNSKRGI